MQCSCHLNSSRTITLFLNCTKKLFCNERSIYVTIIQESNSHNTHAATAKFLHRKPTLALNTINEILKITGNQTDTTQQSLHNDGNICGS